MPSSITPRILKHTKNIDLGCNYIMADASYDYDSKKAYWQAVISISDRVEVFGGCVEGVRDSNAAELCAAVCAMSYFKNRSTTSFVLFTDSEFVNRHLTKHGVNVLQVHKHFEAEKGPITSAFRILDNRAYKILRNHRLTV